MGPMNLYNLKTCILGSPCRFSEVFYQLMNFGYGQFLWNGSLSVSLIHQRPWIGRSRFHGRPQKTLASAMFNLNTGYAVIVFNGIRQPSQTYHIFVIADSQLVGRRFAAVPVHKGILHNNHAHLAFCQIFIAPHQPGRYRTIHMA